VPAPFGGVNPYQPRQFCCQGQLRILVVAQHHPTGPLRYGVMSLKTIQVLECVFAILAAIGLSVDSIPRSAGWFCGFIFLSLDTWRCLRVGKISTGSNYKWYGFTFNRDDSPEIFTIIAVLQILLTLVFFFKFACSL
jgi:hypothetical protein